LEQPNKKKWRQRELSLSLKDAAVEQDNTVLLSKKTYSKMINKCRRGLPNEACGLLSGRGNRCLTVWPMKNIEPTPFSFAMDINQQEKTLKKMKDINEDFIGIYHSHPNGVAFPSEDDVRHAVYPEVFYFVISIGQKKENLKCYRIKEGKVENVEVLYC
jgi:[CysO sulfur-carrier protein]-S-L-cysteine hydrolase